MIFSVSTCILEAANLIGFLLDGVVADVTTCLDAVPNMFFQPTFDLTDPNTFEEVMNLPSATSLQEEVSLVVEMLVFFELNNDN